MKKLASSLIILLLFVAITAVAVMLSINTVSSFAEAENVEKTALVQERLDETLNLLDELSADEYIRSHDVSFLEKAEFLTNKNLNEDLGYMMIRILDGDINIYREGVGATSNLSSREYMQKLYATGEHQVTDAFLAGADGKTINYTVTAAIMENNKVTSALMAAIYASEIDEYLLDEDSINVLVGSQLQYMGGIPEEQFGLSVAQVLESEQTTSRPVENILLDFNKEIGGSFWGIGGGIRYFTYSPVEHCDWVVMTEVQVLPMITNILIGYGCAIVLLIVIVLLINRRKPHREAE